MLTLSIHIHCIQVFEVESDDSVPLVFPSCITIAASVVKTSGLFPFTSDWAGRACTPCTNSRVLHSSNEPL